MNTSKIFTNESKVRNLLYSPAEETRNLGFAMLNQVKSMREFAKRLFMDAISDLRTAFDEIHNDVYAINKNFFVLRFSTNYYRNINSWSGRLELHFENSLVPNIVISDYWLGEPNQKVFRLMLKSIMDKSNSKRLSFENLIEDKLYKNYHKHTKT